MAITITPTAMAPLATPKAVHRLIRCGRTRRYLMGDGWTEDPKQATVFPDEMSAVRACVEHKLTGVQLVLCDPVTHVELFSTIIR